MHSVSAFTFFMSMAWLASAAPAPAPLNINLGAYSPALVVGDGAISFAGAEGAGEAAEVVNGGPAAEGAQVAQAPQTIDGAVTPDQAAGGEVVTAQEQTPVAAQDTTLLQGMGKQRLPKD